MWALVRMMCPPSLGFNRYPWLLVTAPGCPVVGFMVVLLRFLSGVVITLHRRLSLPLPLSAVAVWVLAPVGVAVTVAAVMVAAQVAAPEAAASCLHPI